MDLYERIQNLAKLQYAISKGEQSAIDELKTLYWEALGATMKRDCYSCRIRAYTELTNLTKEKINIMKNQKYTFKDNDALVLFEHNHYTNKNLTDDVAIAMVNASKENANLFNGSFDELEEEKPKGKKGGKSKGSESDVDSEENVIEVPAETVIDPAKSE